LQVRRNLNIDGIVPLATTSTQQPFAYFVVYAKSARADAACNKNATVSKLQFFTHSRRAFLYNNLLTGQKGVPVQTVGLKQREIGLRHSTKSLLLFKMVFVGTLEGWWGYHGILTFKKLIPGHQIVGLNTFHRRAPLLDNDKPIYLPFSIA
jgi:hypothetical protein